LRDSYRRLKASGNLTRFLEALSLAELKRAVHDWPAWAGRKQRPPLVPWRTWLMLGGRGAGKTRAGAQWLSGLVGRDGHYEGDAAGRVAIIGETYADARAVMVEGESGLLAVSAPGMRPQWNAAKRELVWPDGTIGQVFSAADPEGLRGSQFGAAWCDDLGRRGLYRHDRHNA
jgi:phage terminase large subunit-like protein